MLSPARCALLGLSLATVSADVSSTYRATEEAFVWRDGVRDFSVSQSAASYVSAARYSDVPATITRGASYEQNARARVLHAGVCTDHPYYNATHKVLLTSAAADADACAVSCDAFYSCQFFEYSNTTKECYMLPAGVDFPAGPTVCGDFLLENTTTYRTFAAVRAGHHLAFNSRPVAFDCGCHYSDGVLHLPPLHAAETPGVRLSAAAAGDFALRSVSRGFSVGLTVASPRANTTGVAFTNRLKREHGHLTLFQRAGVRSLFDGDGRSNKGAVGGVSAVVFRNGVVEFRYYADACVTPEPVLLLKGMDGYVEYNDDYAGGGYSNWEKQRRPQDATVLNPFFPAYDLLFEKTAGGLLRVVVNGHIRCEKRIVDDTRHTRLYAHGPPLLAAPTSSYDKKTRHGSIEGIMGFAAAGRPAYEVYSVDSTFRCQSQSELSTAVGLDRTATDCGARCFTAPMCTHFLYHTAEETLGASNPDHQGVPSCTLFSDCSINNATLFEQTNSTTFNGTLYTLSDGAGVASTPHYTYSFQSQPGVCLRTRTDPPTKGAALYGGSCGVSAAEPLSYHRMPAWGTMFFLDAAGFVRSVYDDTLCVTCASLRQPCTLDSCGAAGYYDTQLFRPDAAKGVLTYTPGRGSGVDACMELTSGADATMERCEGESGVHATAAYNQTLTFLARPEQTREYTWRVTHGFLGWTTEGVYQSTNPYVATDTGLRPETLVAAAADSTEEIALRSPMFCGPVHRIQFRIEGDAGTTAVPGVRGFLGVILRDAASGGVLQSFTKYTSSLVDVEWTGAAMGTLPGGSDARRCFTLELYDASPGYLVLQTVKIVTSGSEGDYCLPTSRLRIRKYDGHNAYTAGVAKHPMRLAEIALVRASDGQTLGAEDVFVHLTSAQANSTAAGRYALDPATTLFDGDANPSRYIELSSVGVQEYVEVALRRPTLVSAVQLTLGCADGDVTACYGASNNYVVEIVADTARGSAGHRARRYASDQAGLGSYEGEGSVVKQFRVLAERFGGGGNATVDVCYAGDATNGTAAAAEPHSECLDDYRDPTAPCVLRSDTHSVHSPYFKLDLGTPQAVSKVVFYAAAATSLQQQYRIVVGMSNNGPYAGYSPDASSSNSARYGYEGGGADAANNVCANATFADYLNVPDRSNDDALRHANAALYRFNNDTTGSSSWGSKWHNTRVEADFQKQVVIVDHDCYSVGRYVYIEYPDAREMSLHEVEVYAKATSLHPLQVNLRTPDASGAFPENNYDYTNDFSTATLLDVKEFEGVPTLRRRAYTLEGGRHTLREGDWSQLACTNAPVRSVAVWGVPCNARLRLAFSTAAFPTFDGSDRAFNFSSFNESVGVNMTEREANAAHGYEPPNSLMYQVDVLPGGEGETYVNHVHEGRVLKSAEAYATNRQCSVYDSWSLSRDGRSITVAHNNVNYTVAAEHDGPLYACVLPYTPGVTVKYDVAPCDPEDFVCSGAAADIRDAALAVAPSLPSVQLSRLRLDKTRGGRAGRYAGGSVGPTAAAAVLSQSQTVERASLPNVTDLGVCGDDYVVVFDKTDASLSVDTLLAEFNATQTVYVKLLFERVLMLPWVFHEGWTLVDEHNVAAYGVSVEGLKATEMIVVKEFAPGELVQLRGTGFATAEDPDAAPYLVCVSRRRGLGDTTNVRDVPLTTASTPILYEDFDRDVGDCSAPYVLNAHVYGRTASSVKEKFQAPHSTVPGSGYHRGWLDCLMCGWKALDGGVLGDWYQMEAQETSRTALVRGVVLQGREETPPSLSEWVVSFAVNYSIDGVEFHTVDNFAEFEGNRDYRTKVTRTFADPVLARFIRIIPLKWHFALGLRAGLLLCNEDERPQSYTGFAKNATSSASGCIVETDATAHVEGSGSLRLRAGTSTDHAYGGAAHNSPCPSVRLVNELPGPFRPSRLAVWGRVSDASAEGAWVFEVTGLRRRGGGAVRETVRFATGNSSSFVVRRGTESAHTAGGVVADAWFCLTVSFAREEGSDNVRELRWHVSSSAPTPRLHPDDPRNGWGTGVVVVDWASSVAALAVAKEQDRATAWFDHLEVFGDTADPLIGLVTPRLSYDDPDRISPARRCAEYVGYNTTGDFTEHRLSALALPRLLRDQCVEACCLADWCTGVVIGHNRRTNDSDTRGCGLLRRRVYHSDASVEHTARDTAYYYHDGRQYQFMLKAAVVREAAPQELWRRFHEVSATALSSLTAAEAAPIFVAGTESVEAQGSREHPGPVLVLELLFEGARLDLTEDVVRSMVTSTQTVAQQPTGFEALKSLMLPPGCIDLAHYPLVRISLFSTPTYYVTADEVLTFSGMNGALSPSGAAAAGGDANTTLFLRGGAVLGWEDLRAVKLRRTAECDGTLGCGGRPCACGTAVCERAYVCGCQHPPQDLPSHDTRDATSYAVGDKAYVYLDYGYVRHVQRRWSRWYDGMAGYLGLEATVDRLVGGALGRDDTEVQATFSDGAQYIFSTHALLKTSGTEGCMFHRRPYHWPFDDPHPVSIA